MSARVGDLVEISAWSINQPDGRGPLVGQIVRQTDIMSEVVTAHGPVTVRTILLTVVQPGHDGTDTHTGGGSSQ